MNTYDIGDMVRLRLVTKNADGVAFDPATPPVLTVMKPDKIQINPTVTKISGTGRYEAFITADIAGTYVYGFELVNAEKGYEEGKFSVKARKIADEPLPEPGTPLAEALYEVWYERLLDELPAELDPGPANVLSIGTITTGSAGSSASATITGTSPSQTLNLTIPRGNTGETGAKGDKGDDGEGTISAATYNAAKPLTNATTNIVHILGLGTFERTGETPTGATPGNPETSPQHKPNDGMYVFETSPGAFALFRDLRPDFVGTLAQFNARTDLTFIRVVQITDGAGGTYIHVGNSTSHADGRSILERAGRKYVKSGDVKLNVKWWSHLIAGTNHKPMIQAAITAARALAVFNPGAYAPTVFIPDGYYNVAELEWDIVPIEGESVGSTRLIYNGNGSHPSGGFVIGDTATRGGSYAHHGIKNLTIIGSNQGGAFPAYGWFQSDASDGIDWGFTMSRIQVGGTFTQAGIRIGRVVNGFLERIRFDMAGNAYCVSVKDSGSENRPFIIRDFTWDNALSGGKGLLRLEKMHGGEVVIEHGRIELNTAMVADDFNAGYRSLVTLKRGDGTASDAARVHFNHVVGFFHTSDDGRSLFVHDENGRSGVTVQRCKFDRTTFLTRSVATGALSTLMRNSVQAGLISLEQNVQQMQGITIQNRKFESRAAIPSASTFHYYRAGDIIFSETPVATGGIGWVLVSPTTGYVFPPASNIATNLSCTSGSATITGTPAAFGYVGANIVLVGAGVAGADLNCQITAIDFSANTWTVSIAPSTSISGTLTARWQAGTWQRWGALVP